jgi:hypothetical protein
MLNLHPWMGEVFISGIYKEESETEAIFRDGQKNKHADKINE